MFCENCGAQLPDDAKFCGSCGARLEEAAPAMAAASVQAPPPVPIPPPSARPQSQGTAAPSPAYAPPRPQEYAPAASADSSSLREPVGVGGFLGMILLQCVPILNIILLFKWSFGRTVNLNRKNLARAILILWILSILIFVGGFALLGETLLPLITQM